MRTLAVAILFAGGLLMAQDQPVQDQTPKSQHLSASERQALRTQSPPIKTSSHKKHRNKHANARVVKDKTSINAYQESNSK